MSRLVLNMTVKAAYGYKAAWLGKKPGYFVLQTEYENITANKDV